VVREVSTATVTGFPPTTSIQEFQYDSRGNVVFQSSILDVNTDGDIESRVDGTNPYNSRGQLVQSITSVDADGDGAFDSVTVTTIVYEA
jgi:hypothetical protein